MKIADVRAWMENFGHKYKYALLIAAAGLVLLIRPYGTQETASAAAQAETRSEAAELEEKLESQLARAEGVGRVAVILSVQSEPERVLAADSDVSVRQDADGGELSTQSRLTHVLLSDASGGESAVTLRCSAAVYRGALVICEGGGRASVRLTVTQAVSALTGLTADRIVVLRME